MTLEQLTSAIYNNVMTGLRGTTINTPFTLDQVEDEIIQERMSIIKQYAAKNLLPLKDLMYAIRCIEVDCEALDRCPCNTSHLNGTTAKHIEIPQTYNDLGEQSIDYVGSTDGMIEYTIYTDDAYKYHKYKRRGADNPYVWIDTTPNETGYYDAFIFNAPPMLATLLVRMIPKDIRQLRKYSCCLSENAINISFIDGEIEASLTKKFLQYYRQMAVPITPNDQTVKT